MKLLIEKKTEPSDQDKDKSQQINFDAPNLTISITDEKTSQKIVTVASFRNHCKAFIYLFFMEKEISFHSPIMFPQLMLESGLLYFLVESGQVQGQAGVGGRDWGILCHWRRGGEGGKRAHQHCTASKAQ